MSIDQNGLNTLLSTLRPKSNLQNLQERREGLMRKLNQAANEQKIGNAGQSNDPEKTDIKQTLVELSSTDQQIQNEIYEEETRKLELERLQREEEQAKSLREKERALAKHERVLENASMSKLLSAAIRNSAGQSLCSWGTANTPGNNNAADSSHNLSTDNTNAVDHDLKESVAFGIAAAEVSRRRKSTELKANAEEALQHQHELAKQAAKKRKHRQSINMTV